VPYVVKHLETKQIYTCNLTNHYGLVYYGTKYWEDEEEAKGQYSTFLQSQKVEDSDQWKVIEMDENVMKSCNVKLKNNDHNLVFIGEDDVIRVRRNC
jgi:hypothetical protein